MPLYIFTKSCPTKLYFELGAKQKKKMRKGRKRKRKKEGGREGESEKEGRGGWRDREGLSITAFRYHSHIPAKLIPLMQ